MAKGLHGWMQRKDKVQSFPGATCGDMSHYLQPIISIEPSVMGGGGGMRPPHNFVVVALMIIKFGTDVKLDVFYTMVTKKIVTSLLLRHYDVITCILADS